MDNKEMRKAVDPLEGVVRKAMRHEDTLLDPMQRESEPLELDCSTGLVPSPGEHKATVMADGTTMTKHLFDHYRLAMYLYLNRALRDGTLSGMVGFKILEKVINRNVCQFPMGGVSFWKIDRKNIYADVKVELKLHSNAGIRIWQGVLVCIISFETGVRFSVEEVADSVDHVNDGCVRLSPFLIAYHTSKMMDSIGETILRKYMPEALTDPSKRDPVELAHRMGLNVIYEEVYNHRGVGSILFFAEGDLMAGEDRRDRLSGEYRKTKSPRMITVPANTIVVNTNLLNERTGAFAVAHECVHFYEHYLFFRLQELGNSDPRNIKTREVIVEEGHFVPRRTPEERLLDAIFHPGIEFREVVAVAELAKLLADRLYTFALQIKDEDTRNRYIKRVQKLQLRKNRKTMIEDAKSVHPVLHSAFDRDNYLFNCRNGTLDLRTMAFRPHDPKDFLTMLSGVTYDPKAKCPRWNQFVTEVMKGDAGTALYLQKALGYTLTGETTLEAMFILYGATSRNGKGTTMETFLKIMGDYGKTSNPELLGTRFGGVNASGPSEEIARLAGARFVNISEPEKKITFNAALVKRMTGNDTLNARFLHENSFDFKPVFKIFINTNYRPNVSDMTLFSSGRLNVIPFERHFEEHEQDKGLKAFFSTEENLSGIFNWCLEGYREFCKHGLEKPEAVKRAIEKYRADSDRIGQFIEAWLEVGERFEVRTSAAYRLYNQWCEKYGYHTENVKNFNNAISTRFELKRKRPDDGSGSVTTMIIGCKFRESELGEEGSDEAAFS